ncbi:MAG: Hsp20/alpha crystallin family protein [Bacteroidota bacterium]
MLVKRNNVIVPSLINDFFRPDWFGGMDTFSTKIPAVNVMESDTDFTLELEIPGFKKEDFNIELDNDVLTISSEVKNEGETKKETYTRREFSVTSFKRAFTLPESVNESAVKAIYKGGILKLTLPKKEEALPKPKRLIEIK